MNGNLETLLASRKPGWSLPQDFYTSASLFDEEMKRIWRRHWLLVGHACEIKNPGDYFTFEMGWESVIVLRQEKGTIAAFFNTCRHRGSRLVKEGRGRIKNFLCPYHQWSYGQDGRLQGCAGIEGEIDKSQFSLAACAVKDVEGLIFLSLAPEPPDFSAAEAAIGSQLKPHGLRRAKIAHEEKYEVKANWKLVWENNRECYHCRMGHPEYIKGNYDATLPDDTGAAKEIAEISARLSAKWEKMGLKLNHATGGVPYFPTPGVFWRSIRTIMRDGWVTQSLDGKPVSRLMGDLTDREVGTLRVSTLPNLWNHSNGDYSMSTRILPLSPDRTAVTVTWMVHEDAVEGKDYDVENLIKVWKLTGEQDWRLCEVNHAGVMSSRYQPGPYSMRREYNVDNLNQWYIDSMQGAPSCESRN